MTWKFFALAVMIATGCSADKTPAPDHDDVPELVLPQGSKLLAACGSSSGYSYYPFHGLVPRDEAGWKEDGISDGYFYLVQDQDGRYDIIFRDASGERLSATEDGASIQRVRQGTDDAAFTVIFERGARTAEIYTFYKEDDGTKRFTTLVSKGGAAPVYRSGIVTGTCRELLFNREDGAPKEVVVAPPVATEPAASEYPKFVSTVPAAFRGRWDELVADGCEGREARFFFNEREFANFEVQWEVTKAKLYSPVEMDLHTTAFDEDRNQIDEVWEFKLTDGGKTLTGRQEGTSFFKKCPDG